MKYLNIVLLILIIFIINPEKGSAQTLIPSNLKADSLLSQMQFSYPFSFIVMGDCQPYDNQLLNETFLEILIQIAELTVPPTFVIICGDLTEYGSELGYIAYSGCISDWMDTTGIPFFSLPGNHEFYNSASFDYYMTYVGPEFDYYFDYGNSRFITINDVQHPDNMYYHINETQLDSVGVWLSTGPENKFAFNHVSIIRDHHGGGFGNMGYEAFHDSLCFYEAVADFNGHHRDYYRHDLDGIYYLTTAGAGGTTGGIFYPPLSYNNYHWVLITVDELNNIFMEMYFYDAGHNATASLYDFQIQPVQIPPTVYINEFMASNSETIADPQGDYDDWIEIYNADIHPVNIGGMYITDDLSDPAKWKIPDTQPDSTTIQPGEYLLLWADEDIEDGVLHLDIKLSVNGEEIGLYTNDLTSIIDSIVFEEQTIDISFGRLPDGSNYWCQMNPTPGYTNNPVLPPTNLNVDELTGFLTWDPPVIPPDSKGGEKTKVIEETSRDLLGYNVYLDGEFEGDTTFTEWQYEDLIIGQTYIAGVSVVYDEGESEIIEFPFTYEPVLNPPQNIEYQIIEDHVLLTWDEPQPGSTSPFLHYNIYVDGNQYQTEETTYEIYGLINGQTYLILITAEYEAGESQYIGVELVYTGTLAGDEVNLFTKLCGNYPNPFNPITTINYSLKENSKVSLKIYNIKWQLVKVIVNEVLPAGEYSIIWNGRDEHNKPVSSGIYFYKLKSGNFEKTRKMVLMK
jgi:hypothetical protein